ncbi:hypothetical protein GCM10010912_01640 [Paenibacillus albidus]|uniref:Diguanylate cyclase n=1 Tax=Paenibacillus albidus TaxID=2041023 RepID=A0A917BWD4_9BACL|nr:hypothetical protein GCM10010912_01640 [Paenibacillus albidus]
MKLSASVGIARFPEDGLDADSLIKHADTAMYSAKENGGSQYQFYDAERDQTSLEQMMLENDLEKALANDQIRLFYQPKIDIRTSNTVGLEALVRWAHPVLGIIPPLQFIPGGGEVGVHSPAGAMGPAHRMLPAEEVGSRRPQNCPHRRERFPGPSDEAGYFCFHYEYDTGAGL